MIKDYSRFTDYFKKKIIITRASPKSIGPQKIVPKQAPAVRVPSRQVEGVHIVKPGLPVLVHELPDGSSEVQSPRSRALGNSAEASQFPCTKI